MTTWRSVLVWRVCGGQNPSRLQEVRSKQVSKGGYPFSDVTGVRTEKKTKLLIFLLSDCLEISFSTDRKGRESQGVKEGMGVKWKLWMKTVDEI